MVRRRRLVDAARGFRLAELESARSVVLEPRIGQGGVLPSLAIPRLRLCACAHTSACHARRTTLYERCASDALTDKAHTRREYFESESTNGTFRIIAISRRRDFQLSPFGLSSRSRRNRSAVPRSLPDALLNHKLFVRTRRPIDARHDPYNCAPLRGVTRNHRSFKWSSAVKLSSKLAAVLCRINARRHARANEKSDKGGSFSISEGTSRRDDEEDGETRKGST